MSRIMNGLVGALFCSAFVLVGCAPSSNGNQENPIASESPESHVSALDYYGTPTSSGDRSFLTFSDQGAWFSYSIPEETHRVGFNGPFSMVEGTGSWSAPMVSEFVLVDGKTQQPQVLERNMDGQMSFASHLEQAFRGEDLEVKTALAFLDKSTAVQFVEVHNSGQEAKQLAARWRNSVDLAVGRLVVDSMDVWLENLTGQKQILLRTIDRVYASSQELGIVVLEMEPLHLRPGESHTYVLTHSITFGGQYIELSMPDTALEQLVAFRKQKSESAIGALSDQWESSLESKASLILVSKCLQTLQTNWRCAAGGLPHDGLFPSYNQKWFNGFWAWDSWKHAAALAQYNPELGRSQVRAMTHFMDAEGFIPDCVFRDTTLEANNYRNTKPPLLGWAVWELHKQDPNMAFLEEMYPLIERQHQWWYTHRDHDADSICEYGSTDGTLIAAKWESGMDNAVRFDNSSLVQNGPGAWSLNQESVDLNAFLYAEKGFLSNIAAALNREQEAQAWLADQTALLPRIRAQFYDVEAGWFFDTSLDGTSFIRVQGCEGWSPLWAGITTERQAHSLRDQMMDPELFFTTVPFPTLSASAPQFTPEGGYWRGPVWLDQVYFAIDGLRKAGFEKEAEMAFTQLLENAEGLLEPGKSIRENYNPITGGGLEAHNFSWSAGSLILMGVGE